ncbi:MAG TPA: hypothetical protein VHL98_16885 [Microvirga sp.]|jgi:hypothetical protein|nr:hypothetical protein [Microvirga sp.]
MHLPVLAVLLVVLPIGGAVITGRIGLIGGAGAAVLAWLYYGQFLDALEEERRRREQGGPRFEPREVAFYTVVVLVAALVAFALNRVYEQAGP